MTEKIESSAKAIYARVKAEIDELEKSEPDAREWMRMTTAILEAVMQCQALVIETQRAVLNRARSEPDATEASELQQLRSDARDSLYYVERLTELYDRVKAKLATPTRRP